MAETPERNIGTPFIYILTHDSIGVGETGPRISRLNIWRCRATPGLMVIAPGGRNEWSRRGKVAMQLQHEPRCWSHAPSASHNRPAKFAPAAGLSRGASSWPMLPEET